LRSVVYVETCAYEDVKAAQMLVDAADARDREAQRLREKCGLDRALAENDQLGQAAGEAFKKAVNFPVTTPGLLLSKWEWLIENDCLDGNEEAITADLERLAALAEG